jgi:hypothetical protein
MRDRYRRIVPLWRRGLAVLLGTGLVMTLAVGPSTMAAAVGLRSSASTTADPQPGFLPEANTVKVLSPQVQLFGLSALDTTAPIPLAGGTSSPSGTWLLVANAIELDNLEIVQNGPAGLKILNPGTGLSDGGTVGTPHGNTTFYLWGHVNSLCMNLGDVLGLLSPALQLLVQAADGACIPVVQILPLLASAINGGALKNVVVKASNLDVDVYALRVDSAGDNTVSLPHGDITVGSS